MVLDNLRIPPKQEPLSHGEAASSIPYNLKSKKISYIL
jgi:hypothetical protein